jgi:hypothetical protein
MIVNLHVIIIFRFRYTARIGKLALIVLSSWNTGSSIRRFFEQGQYDQWNRQTNMAMTIIDENTKVVFQNWSWD